MVESDLQDLSMSKSDGGQTDTNAGCGSGAIRTSVKAAAYLTCIVTMIYQGLDCLNRLLDPPVFTRVGLVPNQTIWLPTTTVCADEANKFNESFLKKLGVPSSSFTDDLAGSWAENIANNIPWQLENPLQAMWQEATWKSSDLILFGGPNYLTTSNNARDSQEAQPVTAVSRFFFRNGQCHEFTPGEPSPSAGGGGRISLGLKLPTKDQMSLPSNDETQLLADKKAFAWELILTRPGESATEFSLPLTSISRISVPRGKMMRITITAMRTTRFPSQNYPCISAAGYQQGLCVSECIWNVLANATVKYGGPCRDVWMAMSNETMSLCKTRDSYVALLRELHHAFFGSLVETECGHCVPHCDSLTYQTTIQSITEVPQRFGIPEGGFAVISYTSATETRFTDTYGYSMSRFLGDLFGNLGFLTGLCVFSLFKWLEIAASQFFSCLKNTFTTRTNHKTAVTDLRKNSVN